MPFYSKTDQAEQDLLEIWSYVADHNIAAADRLLDMLEQKFTHLAEMPGTGAFRRDVGDGMRHFPVGRYLILYRDIPDGIEVVRVVHGARVLGQMNLDDWVQELG